MTISKKRNAIYLGLAVLGLVLVAYVSVEDEHTVSVFTQENGVVETVSVGFYLLAIIACYVAIRRLVFRKLAYIWLVLCIVFLGEETSWMQHYIGYSVPKVQQYNLQNEFNLHNLSLFQRGDLINEKGYLEIGLGKLFSAQTIFRIGFFSYFLLFPLMQLNKTVRTWSEKLGMPVIPPVLFASIWIPIFFSIACAINAEPTIRGGLAETRELLYASSIFMYCWLLRDKT